MNDRDIAIIGYYETKIELINCPPDQVKIGMPVRLAWVKAGDMNFPVFEPHP